MKTSDLSFDLPEDLVAQQPSENRDASRLLVLDRGSKTIREVTFRDLPNLLEPGDCLALNDTRVIRARLSGKKATGGTVEIFLLREVGPGDWEALVRPSARVKPGTKIALGKMGSLSATVTEKLDGGLRRVRFDEPDVLSALESAGEIPLPPYIHRATHDDRDAARYQTVYAKAPGAVAAPTAGLHFTDTLMHDLDARGIGRAPLTLHVGYGTFKPIQADRLEDHAVGPEDYVFPETSARMLNETRRHNRRVVAIGTTTTRVLESCYEDGAYVPGEGSTRLYIHPPYRFAAVDALLTNFHLPRSSLLALVCAFGGTEFILEAYRHAVKNRFRFYSYGDAMLIL